MYGRILLQPRLCAWQRLLHKKKRLGLSSPNLWGQIGHVTFLYGFYENPPERSFLQVSRAEKFCLGCFCSTFSLHAFHCSFETWIFPWPNLWGQTGHVHFLSGFYENMGFSSGAKSAIPPCSVLFCRFPGGIAFLYGLFPFNLSLHAFHCCFETRNFLCRNLWGQIGHRHLISGFHDNFLRGTGCLASVGTKFAIVLSFSVEKVVSLALGQNSL